MINFFDLFSVDTLYIVLGLAGVSLITLILAIVALCKAAKLKKKYRSFMEGADGKSIESLIHEHLDEIESIRTVGEKNSAAVKDIYEKMQYTFQKVGIVKYDAFHEMGGRLSFALCMLDKVNNGYIINVMHSNNGCFAYIKEVVDGKKVTVYDEVEKEIKKDMPSRLHARRQMLKTLYGVTNVPTAAAGRKRNTKKVDLPAKLFDEIAPKYVSRNGGYTRIVKIGQRKGDGAMAVLLELV